MAHDVDEINGRLFAGLLDYASLRLGPEAARSMLEDVTKEHGRSLMATIDPRSWAPLALLHGASDVLRPLLGDAFMRDAVAWAIPVRRDFSAMSITALTEPTFFYRHIDRARTFFARHVELAVDACEPGKASVRLIYRDGVPRRRESCDVGRGVLTAVPLLFELPAAELEESTCYARGDAECAYTVRWRSEPALGAAGFVLGGVAGIAGALLLPHFAWAGVPLAGWLIGREVRHARRRRHMARITEDHRRVLEENERDFERRYREIRQLNDELEKRVAERTAQIRAAMEELREGNATMREAIAQMNRIHADVIDAGVRGLMGNDAQELAHEIKNPLTYVLANLQFLEEATLDRPHGSKVPLAELADIVRDVRLGVDRIRGVLAWFLELYRGDREAIAPYDLDQELAPLVSAFRAEWHDRIQVHLDLGGVPPIRARGRQLGQVVANILTHASQAMRTGNIWIATRREEDRVIISIKDDGPGIAEDALDHLFEREHMTTSGVESGLGLFVARVIVERHGGAIRAIRGPGRGASIRVEIPMA